jgi:hypothetical protein
MTRRALATVLFAPAAAAFLVLVVAAVVFLRPDVTAAPAENAATVGALRYRVENSWVLDPHRASNAQLVRGVPAADRALGKSELLYAVFVGVTNPTSRRLPMATDVALQDPSNRRYAPVPLGAANRFAYRPRTLTAQSHAPALSTPAGRDPAAEGLLLVFRIPRQAYLGGSLELLVRDPADPAAVRTIQLA